MAIEHLKSEQLINVFPLDASGESGEETSSDDAKIRYLGESFAPPWVGKRGKVPINKKSRITSSKRARILI